MRRAVPTCRVCSGTRTMPSNTFQGETEPCVFCTEAGPKKVCSDCQEALPLCACFGPLRRLAPTVIACAFFEGHVIDLWLDEQGLWWAGNDDRSVVAGGESTSDAAIDHYLADLYALHMHELHDDDVFTTTTLTPERTN